MKFRYRQAVAWPLRLVLPALLACACRSAPGPSSDAVASYRGGEVLKTELQRVAPPPPAPDQKEGQKPESDWRKDALESIVVRRVLAPEASASDRDLQNRIDGVRKTILAAALRQELGWNAITASDQEARAEYEKHPEQYSEPEKIRFQHIYLRAETEVMSPAERAAVRKRLEDIRKEILAGADFDAMARKYSQSSDSQSGGWSGLKRGDKIFESFSDVAFGLKVDEVSQVVDTPTGFHLIKLKEKSPAKTRTFEEMKEFARQHAVTAKQEALQEAFLQEYGKKYGLVRSYERLEDPMIQDDTPLVTVGSSSLTMRQLVDRLPPPLLEHLFNLYFPTIHRFLDGIALEEVLIQEAEARGIGKRPAIVESIRIATEEVKSQAALEERLKKKVAALPEQELRDFFKQNEKRFQTLRTWDLDVILLKPMPKENFWRVLKRAEALAKRIQAGEDFATLARKYSQHYTAREGGRMMGLTDQDIAQRVQSTAKFRRMRDALKDGEVGPAMVAECYDPERLVFVYTGALVVRLVHAHPPVPQTYEQVKGLVAENYLRRYHQRLEAETRKTVLESVAFRVYPERLPPL